MTDFRFCQAFIVMEATNQGNSFIESFGAHPLTKKPRDAGNEIASAECTETPLGPIKHATFSSPELRSYWSTILDAGAIC